MWGSQKICNKLWECGNGISEAANKITASDLKKVHLSYKSRNSIQLCDMSTGTNSGLKDALKPVIYVSQFLSLTFFHKTQMSRFKMIMFYRIVALTLLLSCLVHEVPTINYWMAQRSGLHAMLASLEIWSRWSILIVNYLLNIANNTRINNTVHHLLDLPFTANQSLNTRVFRFQICHMVFNLSLIICFMGLGHNFLWENMNYKWYTSIIYIVTEFYITFGNIQFVDFLFVVRQYYRTLNEHLKKYNFGSSSVPNPRTLLFLVTDSYRRHDVFDIARFRELHLNLCCVSHKLNQCYSVQVLFFVVLSMIEITYSLRSFMMYMVKTDKVSDDSLEWSQRPLMEFTLTAFWGGYYLSCLLQIVCLCGLTVSESKQTSLVVHEMINRVQDKDLERQLMNHTAIFTAGRFFNLDFALIHSIVGTITTYLVIIVTFKD